MATNPRWSVTGGTSTAGTLYIDRRDHYLHPQKTAELWGATVPFWSWTTKLNTESTSDPDLEKVLMFA